MKPTIALAGPVSAFFEAERTQDLEALARCFSDHAVVHDEGRTLEGHDAIKRWMKEANAKYQHTVEPLAVSHRDGTTVVIARVAGAFPNSPLELEHVFAIGDGRIVSLVIR
jgi:ketosteroid isomerase-like protein